MFHHIQLFNSLTLKNHGIIITKPADLCNIDCYTIMLDTSANVTISKKK